MSSINTEQLKLQADIDKTYDLFARESQIPDPFGAGEGLWTPPNDDEEKI
jgi:hypothetical protein